MKLRLVVLGLITGFSCGCASNPYGKPLKGQLDRAIRYTEITKDGEELPLSEVARKDGKKEMRVPVAAEVDINSSIAIHISTSQIQILEGHQSDLTAVQISSVRSKSLGEAISTLAMLIEARLKAVKAHQKLKDIPVQARLGTQSYSEFSAAQSEFATEQEAFNNLSIWEDGTFSAVDRKDAFENDPNYQKMGALLQRKLDEAEAAFKQTVEKAKRNSGSLRLEAFLETPRGHPTAIHLEGYDKLSQKEIRLKDPFVMDADDREAFESQFNQVADLARQAERLRKGEMSLNEALLTAGPESLKRLAELIEQFRPLVKEGWPALAEKVENELKDFSDQVQQIASQHGTKEAESTKQAVSKLSEVLKRSKRIEEIRKLVAEIETLNQDWQKVTPGTLIATANHTEEVYREAKKALSSATLSDLEELRKSVDETLAAILQRPPEIPEEVWQDIRKLLEKPETLATAKLLVRNLVAAKQFAEEVLPRLSFAPFKPVKTDIRTPEVFDVPVDEAPNTVLELQRTSRILDDQVSLTGTLNLGQKEYDRTEASFTVRQFGWHSVLAPSVILDKPTRTTSSYDRDFKFAPAVAWLQKYYPRNSDDSILGMAARFFQAGLGLHVAFVNHDPQKDAQVGLGLAASFWHDRIVTGFGWNLMSNSRSYYYVGSNLIPILQALGFGREGAAGKKP